MQCRQGSLILQQHNDVAGEWHMLYAEALKPSAVTDEPRIPTYQPAPAPGAQQCGDPHHHVTSGVTWQSMTSGDVAPLLFLIYTDCASYQQGDPANVFRSQEHAKKRLYGE